MPKSNSRILLLSCVAVLFFILCALGVWQVKRLAWKENLIATVEQRIKDEPAELAAIEKRWIDQKDVDYWPVKLKGAPVIGKQVYYYNTLNGKVGWNVITPFRLDNGRYVLVNRGFLPDEMRKGFVENQVDEIPSLQITGLARNPVHEKPNRFMPDNDLAKRNFFWKNQSELAQLTNGLGMSDALPFLIDMKTPFTKGAFPRAGTTRISFPNNHLGYAVTWFGLALSLLLVSGWFFFSNRKK